MHLPGIDDDAFAGLNENDMAVNVILHGAGEDKNKFKSIMPVIRRGIVESKCI